MPKPLPLLLLVFLLASAGCGLSDYEKQMDQQRARIKIFDEQNKYLGDVLEMPKRKVKEKVDDKVEEHDVPAWPFEIFLRLPRGIERTVPEKGGVFQASSLVFCRFLGPEGASSVIVTVALVGVRDDKTKTEDKTKAKDSGSLTPDEFRDQVRVGVGNILNRNFPPSKPQKVTLIPKNYKGEQQGPLAFELMAYEDPPEVKDAQYVAIYLHQKAGRQAALTFQQPAKNKSNPTFMEGVDRCLKSLDISEQAAERRAQYIRTKRW